MSGILFDRARSGPDPPWCTVGDLVREAAERSGGQEFLRFRGASLTFAAVHETSNRLAHVLVAHGIRPGDRVAIMLGNVPDWPLCWFAVLKAGAIAVPVNARYRESDLRFVLADSGAVLVLTSVEHAGLVRAAGAAVGTVREVWTVTELAGELAGAPPGDLTAVQEPAALANFQYTSGTTGFPKACMLSHGYWLRTGWLTAIEAELRADDVMLIAQAFSYMDPQWASVMCLMGGRPLVVLPRFSASGFWTSAREHGATLTYVLGAMPMLMWAQPPRRLDRDNSVRLVLCSGIVPDLHRRFEELALAHPGRRRQREGLDELQVGGHLERRQLGPGMVQQTDRGLLIRRVAGRELDERLRQLTKQLVGDGHQRRRGDRRMQGQHMLHLSRGDVLPAPPDHVGQSSRVVDPAVGVAEPEVAGVVPTA